MTTEFHNPEHAVDFVKAGHAIVTFRSKKTGTRFTYRVVAPKHNDNNIRFVGLLTGPENTTDYQYMGIITSDGQFKRTAKSRVGEDAPSYKAFQYVYNSLAQGQIPQLVEIFHEGRCGRCGRVLTVPESIERGIGPECIKYI
jgi:hypothetical protein